MSDIYESTNKLPDNPYPERSHLLMEGIIDIEPSDYQPLVSSSGFYIASGSIDLTRLIKLGNRLKGFGPETLEAKVWHNDFSSAGGDLRDTMAPLPITKFSSYNALTPIRHCYFDMQNVYVVSDDLSATYLMIVDVRNSAPGRTQSFSYKVYNTIYKFTDTL